MKYNLITVNNSKLKPDGIAAISLLDGATCPGAKECLKWCYAANARKAYPALREKLERATACLKHEPALYFTSLYHEIVHSEKGIVRWHDSGDITGHAHFSMMCAMADCLPHVHFYTYTKSIHVLVAHRLRGNIPANLVIIQSYGGRFDHLISTDYPTARAIPVGQDTPAGYIDGSHSDLVAAFARSGTKIAVHAHGARKGRIL